MNRSILALALALAAAPRASAQSVTLMCRGPLEISTGQTSRYDAPTGYGPVIVFRPGRSAAGQNGQELEAGTCAFPDRGLGDGEPRVMLLGLYRSVGYAPGDRNPSNQNVLDGVVLNVRELLEVDRQVSFLSRGDYITVLLVTLRTRPGPFWETGLGRAERLIPVRDDPIITRDPRDRTLPPR